MQDWELLADYLRTGSQSAFAEVVERYINLVYATCLREIKDPQLAEDATQAVFIILLKKAHTIRPGTVLSSWFFSTARYVALDAVRHEGRRQRREQKAAAIMIQDLGTPGSNLDWERIEPLLHEALAHLNQDDRNAVLLRYFEGKSLKQTGLAMGISEDAARLRVARAVERMRGFFARHGFSVGAAVLVGLIYDHAVSAAPASCHAAVLQLGSRLMAPANMGVSAMVAGAGPSGGIIVGLTTDAVNVRVLSLVDRVSRLMLMNHIKIATTACAGLALILCGAGKLAHLARASAPPTVTVMGRPMHHAAAPRALTIHKPLRLAEALVPYGHKASDQAGEDIQAGEIQVEGRIHSVDTKHKTLVVDVASFTLPDGKTHELNPVKAKTITLSDGTVLHVRGAEQHVVTLTALKDLGDGVFAIAVGRDLGSGHALPARDVGVWTRVQAGRPLFDPPQKPRDTEGDPALDPGQPVVLAPAFRPAPPGAATKPAGAAPAPSGQRVASPESILGVGAGAAPAPTLTHASAVNATAILTQLWTITANTQFYRPSILAALAYHDPAAALTLVADPPDPIPDAMLGPIAVAAAEGDPEHAARWAPEHLRQLQLPFWRFRATARTAVLLADKEPEVAMELYRMAQDAYNDTTAEVPVNHGNNAERLATLSWLAHKLNREDEAKPFDAALVREIKAMRYRPWWILQQLYALAPRQDLMLLNQITAPDRQAGKDESPTAILFAAMIAARFDPPRAKLLFSGVLPALTQQDPGAVGRDEDAAPAATGSTGELLVRSLDAKDAALALEVARSINDADVLNKPVALATAAAYLPHDVAPQSDTGDAIEVHPDAHRPQAVALQVLSEAEALLNSPQSGFEVPAQVASIASAIDPSVGNRLFAVAKARFDAAAAQRQETDEGPSVAKFAFYYSRRDPALSRKMLDAEFARRQANLENAPPGVYAQEVSNMSRLAVAMVAINPARALAMCRLIPSKKMDGHDNPPFVAQRDIALYLLLPERERLVKPFRQWDPGSLWRA